VEDQVEVEQVLYQGKLARLELLIQEAVVEEEVEVVMEVMVDQEL
tara:strand:+ start:645 stop:779 length:135 start_codon:yes stop_codon:yes gene_type:complete